jgi:phosphoserine phosphatase
MDLTTQLARIEALEAEAIDRFHRRIMALRADKQALREALEQAGHKAAIVRKVYNPLQRERFRRIND